MKKMTLMQHFSELRRRMMCVLLIFLILFGVGWYVSPHVLDFISRPLFDVWPNGILLYTGLTDGFMIRLSLSALIGLCATVPAILWHIWAFITPGLKIRERRFIWPIMIASPVLFVLGAAFAFYLLFPVVFSFFIDMNKSTAVPAMIMPVVRDYLSFSLRLLKMFGLAFQLPLIMIMLNRCGVLSRTRASGMRRYAICGIVIIAAVLTPPDIVSQVLLAVPMYLLFEAGLLFMHRD